MADETIVGDPELEEEASEGQKTSLVKWLLLLIPLALIPATAGAYMAYTQYPDLTQAALAVGWNLHAQEDERARPEFGQFTSMENLLINPAGTGGGRYLLVNLGLESKSADVLKELAEKEIVVRDVVLNTLGQRTVPELSSITQRDSLKEELRLAINELLVAGEVDRLYFTQYVLQ